MDHNLIASPEARNTADWASLPIVVTADTIEVFAKKFPYGFRRAVEQHQGQRIQFKDFGRWGAKAYINRPTAQTVKFLAQRQAEYRLRLTRLDVAYDFHCGSPSEAQALRHCLEQHLLLKWRRAGFMKRIDETLYWNNFADKKRPPRNLALYNRNDLTPHLELRLLKGEAVQRSGCARIQSLFELNTQELFHKHLKFIDNSAAVVRQKWIRDAVQNDIGRRSRNAFEDNYRSRLQVRVASLFDRTESGLGQRYKDLTGEQVKLDPYPSFNVPKRISFGWGLKTLGE